MPRMKHARGYGLLCAAVLAVAMFDVSHATQWLVGGNITKWNHLHAGNGSSWYNTVWSANITFRTGDYLLFEYDNSVHSVLEFPSKASFNTCDMNSSVLVGDSGRESILISKAGTSYYGCGGPSHCQQGMKVYITATGPLVAVPSPPVAAPTPSNNTDSGSTPAPSPNKAPLSALYSGTVSLLLAISLAATHAVVIWL